MGAIEMRKPIIPEQLFYDNISKLIKNLFIKNVNFKNGYYNGKSQYEFEKDIKEMAQYILDEMEQQKHLINI